MLLCRFGPRPARTWGLVLLGSYMLAAGPQVVRAQADASGQVTAFVDVNVVPLDHEQVLPHRTVVIRHGRIAALGPARSVRIPARARRIDGRRKYLIPGLADMHAHVPGFRRVMTWYTRATTEDPLSGEGTAEARRMLFLWLANGVTTVRIMGYASPEILAFRRQAATGAILSPRIYAGIGPVDRLTPDSAVRLIAAGKAAGYDFVKLHGVSGATFDSAVAAAHRFGMPIAGHVPGGGVDGAERAVRVGYASIEHLIGLEAADEPTLRALAIAFRRSGVWNCPTLINNTRFAAPPTPDAPELRYYADSDRAKITEYVASAPAQRDDTTWRTRIVQVLHWAGAGLLLGTDAPLSTPGFSVHRELEALVRAGLTPYEALRTGTYNVAAYFGTLDSTGTVAVGKRADLVLLDGNPLEDIRHTAQPAGVMVGGRWLPRTLLDQILVLIEGTLYH